MKQKNLFWALALWLVCLLLTPAKAARVDTLAVHSPSMNRTIDMVVIVPDQSLGNEAVHCPVIYLLHGFGNNHFAWLQIKPNLPQIADREGLIFVCPNGKDSWYWDSPQSPDYRFETFISQEMIAYVDSHYATIANRTGRAITGLSMGGQGAMWNAIRHKEVFGAAGSTSGGVDIRPFPKSWNMSRQLGDKETHPEVWEQHAVINQVKLLQNHDLALIIDCGEDDFFLEVNKAFHQKLLEHGIAHDFITRPGSHNWTYWNNSIDYQILFFKKHFEKIVASAAIQPDLYLCIGQSNMAGRGKITEAVGDTLQNVYLWNDQQLFEPANNPLNRYSTIRKSLNMQGVGPAYSFARTMQAVTQRPIGLVVNARGGSSIKSWEKGCKDGYYEEALGRLRQAMRQGQLKAVLWHQGESDVQMGEAYLPLLMQLIANLRQDLGRSDLPFIFGEIAEWAPTKEQEKLNKQFNRLLRRLPKQIPHTACVTSKDLKPLINESDPHFSAESQLILGERYAEALLRIK